MPTPTKTIRVKAMSSVQEIQRFVTATMVPQVRELQRVVGAIGGRSIDLQDNDPIVLDAGIVTMNGGIHRLPTKPLPGWTCVLIVEADSVIKIPRAGYTLNGGEEIALESGFRGLVWFFSDTRFFTMAFPSEAAAVEPDEPQIDETVLSADIVSANTLLTLDGVHVRGQLQLLADAVSEIEVLDEDDEISSANITSADSFTVLTGPTVRDQLQQLLDGILARQRNYEMGNLIESLGYRHEIASPTATFLAKIILVYGETNETNQSRWHAFRTTATVTVAGSNSADTPNGTAWTSRTAPATAPLTACWNAIVGGDQGRHLIAGASAIIRTSDDLASTWSLRTPAASYAGQFNIALQQGSNGFLLAGTGGEIQRSSDGATWSRTYNTGGDFLHAAQTDNYSQVVAIRASSFVHSSNLGASGFTDSSLPLSGALFVAYHKGHGWLVVGTDGSAVSSDGINWTQVETAQICSGTLRGLHAVAGGFLIWNDAQIYWTTRPSVVGSWTAFTGGAPAVYSGLDVGVDNNKREVIVVWRDTVNSKPWFRKSIQARYV